MLAVALEQYLEFRGPRLTENLPEIPVDENPVFQDLGMFGRGIR
jgi:hypothetical protein